MKITEHINIMTIKPLKTGVSAIIGKVMYMKNTSENGP
jgi:hypothetical protein